LIKDLSDLKELVALCRKAGVREIKLGDVSLVLGEAPPPRRYERKAKNASAPDDPLMPDMPSDEELINWSAQPHPGLDA
jgi:hypothetical protein